MSFTRHDLLKLLDLIDVTAEVELDCDGLLHRVAAYLEELGPDGVPPPGHEAVVHHLRVCPECLEEVTALWRALRADGR